MANPNHLKKLKEGVDRWNEWRKENPDIRPNLSGSNLGHTDFSRANFSKAYMDSTSLVGANFREANLEEASLIQANLYGTTLIKANLDKAILMGANLNKADLRYASLAKADLIRADLCTAILHNVDLSEADLWAAQALETDFNQSTLTGARVQDWNINSKTNLDRVICKYIYLGYGQQERCPLSRDFAPGEFTKLHQKLENVVELIFHNGLNWRAFAFAFNEVNTQIIDTDESGEMFLREYKVLGDGLVALQIVTPPRVDKTKIREELMSAYEKISQLEGELRGKDAILAGVLDKVFSMTGETYNNHYYGNIANSANKLEGNARQQANQYNYTAEQKQILIETAQEIQQIYDHLLQTQPSKAWDELELTKQVKAELEKRPTLKERFVGLLKNGLAEALKELVNRSGFNILLEAARGWMNPE